VDFQLVLISFDMLTSACNLLLGLGCNSLSAIKSVLGGGGNNNNSGGGFQQKLVSAAMSHAADLYDKKDGEGQAQGNKQDAVNQAAQMAMGLAMKNPAMLAGLIGGGNSGGLGALAGMLGK
jgi:hypothetical protein